MGKCVRIRGGCKPPAAATAAASCLTLRSGRRVPPGVASSACSSPRTSGRPRGHRRSALRCRGAEGAKKSVCGTTRSSSAADMGSPKVLCDDDGRQEEEAPSSATDTGAAVVARGDSFERPKTTPLTTDDCDAAAAVKVTAKHGNESRCRGVDVAGQTLPKEAEIEAFFAAAELAERRRFAEAYNYDVALDRPLEGRFEWEPVSTRGRDEARGIGGVKPSVC